MKIKTLISAVVIAMMITCQVAIVMELRDITRRLGDIRKSTYDIEMEVSQVAAVSTNMGFIGERVSVNGEE